MNERLDEHIQHLYREHRGCYGYRRIWAQLRLDGFEVSLNRVRRRMNTLGLKGWRKLKFIHTTDSNHHLKIHPNRLNRAFNPPGSNQAWVGDITYLKVNNR